MGEHRLAYGCLFNISSFGSCCDFIYMLHISEKGSAHIWNCKRALQSFLTYLELHKNAGQVAHPKAWIFLWKMDHVSPQWKETKTLLHVFSKQTWTDCSYLLTHEAVTMGMMTCPHLARALLAYHRKSWQLGICLRWIRIVDYPYIPQRPYNPIL